MSRQKKKDLKTPKTVGLSGNVLRLLKARADKEDRSESWVVNNILERELQA